MHGLLPLAYLSFRSSFPLWAAFLCFVALAALTIVLYRRESARLGQWRWPMATLRICLFAALIFLLLRPVLVFEQRGQRPRSVAILLDNTQSMNQREPRQNLTDRQRVAVAVGALPANQPLSASEPTGNVPSKPSRAELARAVLSNSQLDLRTQFAKKGPVKTYLFGTRVRTAAEGADADALSAFTADEARTALADAVSELLQQDENDRPAAVFVLTDGRDNASRISLDELGRECVRAKVPLHIYGVGVSGVGVLQLKETAQQDTLFVDDTVSVPVRWRCRGFTTGTVEVSVLLNGRVVAQRTVPVREGEDLSEVLAFTPTKSDAAIGKQELVTSVKMVQGSETYTDEVKKSVRVVDRKVKVLVIERAPRWEFKYLQRALLRDRRVELKCLLTEGDSRTAVDGSPYLAKFPATRQELFAYDLLILGDVPAGYFVAEGADRLDWLKDFVAEGGGMVLLAGRQYAPADYVGKSLAEVLPVEFVAQKPILNEMQVAFSPRLTPEGERSDLLALADTPEENLKVWQQLPGQFWHYPVTKLKPGAVSLLAHPKLEVNGKPMPLLASQYYGKGLVFFLAIDETWRWRFNEEDKRFARFWGQMVYQAGLPRTGGTKLAQLALDRSENVVGRTGQVFARLFTPEFRPVPDERVEARLERLDAKDGEERVSTVILDAVPGQPGEFAAPLPHEKVGRYALRLKGNDSASLEYRVTLPPEHELATGGLAEDALRKLAQQSNGGFYREEDLHKVADALVAQSVPFVVRREIILWNGWMLVVVVVLFSVEWLARKFGNLS
jgi:hypothetical protein